MRCDWTAALATAFVVAFPISVLAQATPERLRPEPAPQQAKPSGDATKPKGQDEPSKEKQKPPATPPLRMTRTVEYKVVVLRTPTSQEASAQDEAAAKMTETFTELTKAGWTYAGPLFQPQGNTVYGLFQRTRVVPEKPTAPPPTAKQP